MKNGLRIELKSQKEQKKIINEKAFTYLFNRIIAIL